MTKYIVIIFLFLVSMSCGNDKIEKPSNLISETKMVDIIVDLALLNSGSGIDKTILEREGIQPESHVYKKYNIDSIQFVTSNDYYAHNIDLYQDIYAQAKSKLNGKKEEYKKLNEKETKEKKKRDSIRVAENRRNKPAIINNKNAPKELKSKTLLKKIDSLPQ